MGRAGWDVRLGGGLRVGLPLALHALLPRRPQLLPLPGGLALLAPPCPPPTHPPTLLISPAPGICCWTTVADVKLVLEAFQLSAAQAVAYPRAPALLRCLMTGRLATAQLSAALQAWLADQRARSYEDGRAALLAGLPRCLLPLTASLDQAGGLQRLTLRGHSAPVHKGAAHTLWHRLHLHLCRRHLPRVGPRHWGLCAAAGGSRRPRQ